MMVPDGEEKDARIECRWACDKKNYYTYVFAAGTWTNRTMYYATHGYYGWCSEPDIRLDKGSREIAEKFLEGTEEGWRGGHDAVSRLCRLEEKIRERKRDREQELKEERVYARVEKRGELPKDWESWLGNHVFLEERYLFYDGKKRKTGFCAHCGTEVPLDGKQRHNGRGKCPACGSRIWYKSKGRKSWMRDEKQVVYLQKTTDGFLMRYFGARKESGLTGERYRSWEVALGTYDGRYTWYDYHMKSGYTGYGFWTDVKMGGMIGWKTKGYLYTRNVRAVLKGTKFQYAPLAEWERHERKELPIGEFLERFEGEPFLEFFVKVGLFRLTWEYVESCRQWGINGNNPQGVLEINKQRINRLARMDGGIGMLEWLRYEEKAGIRIADVTLAWLEEQDVSVFGCGGILEELGSVERMVNYMKKQEIRPREVAGIWSDYLRMARAEGLDTTDDIVRLPKDLKRRHDELAEIGNRREEERREKERRRAYAKMDRQIRKRMPQAERYRWENGKYMVIPAKKCGELVEEGRTLHHCVGSGDQYMRRMAEGRTWILFLRRKGESEKPYYTIEIDMESDEILQWYSEFDRKPDGKAIRKVLDTFLKSVKKKRKKEERVRVLLETA